MASMAWNWQGVRMRPGVDVLCTRVLEFIFFTSTRTYRNIMVVYS